MDKVKYAMRAKKMGGSLWLRIPSEIVKQIKLTRFHEVDVTLENFKIIGIIPLVTYRCRSCEHVFTQSEEIPYCPACACENLAVIETEEEQ